MYTLAIELSGNGEVPDTDRAIYFSNRAMAKMTFQVLCAFGGANMCPPPPSSFALLLSPETCNSLTLPSRTRPQCLSRQNYDGVIEDCSAALELNPEHTKSLLRRAKAYEAIEKFSKALADYRWRTACVDFLFVDKFASQARPGCGSAVNPPLPFDVWVVLFD